MYNCAHNQEIPMRFQFGPIYNAKIGYMGKTQTTNSYRPQLHVNSFNQKRNLHKYTCNILHFIQLGATQSSWNSQAKTVSTSTNINTLTFLTSHTTAFFLFLTDLRRQATVHTQPRSSNIFVQHDKDIMTQYGICKDTDAINYIKLRMRNTSQHELNTRYVRQII